MHGGVIIMKKLLATLVITLGTAALAQSDVDTKTQQENQRNDTSRIETGVDSTEVLPGLSGSKAQKQADKQQASGAQKTSDAALMNKANAFNLNGTLKKGSDKGEITLSRQNQNLPDVDLDVREQTQVMLDGKKVAVADIPEGAQVRARFQLVEDDVVAVEINATSPKKGTQSK
jgi:flagellar motor protein MotB